MVMCKHADMEVQAEDAVVSNRVRRGTRAQFQGKTKLLPPERVPLLSITLFVLIYYKVPEIKQKLLTVKSHDTQIEELVEERMAAVKIKAISQVSQWCAAVNPRADLGCLWSVTPSAPTGQSR